MGKLNETTAQIQAAIDKAQALPDYHDAETRAEVFNDTENNTAGTYGHAEGIQTAAGPYGHAEGNRTSTGDTAHAEGYKTKALGQFSHAEGSDCTCESGAPRSHAEGFNTKTSAPNSHAEGNGSHVLQGGDAGHCEGNATWVWSFCGHAEGNQTQAWDTAHAEGYLCQAQGTLSHAGGYGSVSSGYCSFAHGLGINATLDYEVAFGKYNANGPRTLYAIGMGAAESDRKNAMEVTTSGNTYLYGVGGYNGTNADGAVPINQLDRPTRATANMNDCLQTGFYPWCTLGRPEGCTGAFSLSVRRASTPDANGFYTVEQTCYGREAELGQVWTRMVFDKGGPTSPNTNYMEWIRVDGAGGEAAAEPLYARAKIGRYAGVNPVVKVELNRELAEGEEIHLFRKTRANRVSGNGYNVTGHVTAYTDFSAWNGSGDHVNDPNLDLKWDAVSNMQWLKDETKSVNGRHQYILTASNGNAFEDFGCFLNVSRKADGFAVIQDGRRIRIRASDAEEHKKYRVQGCLHLAAGVVKATGGNKNENEYVLVSPIARFKVTFRHDGGNTISWNPSVE